MSSQLVAYSGFSATNYIQEPFSADLDFGVGEFSFGSWFKTISGNNNVNLIRGSDNIQINNGAGWQPYYYGATITSGITAPDGTSTAFRLKAVPSSYKRGGILQEGDFVLTGPCIAGCWMRVTTGTAVVVLGLDDYAQEGCTVDTTWKLYTVASLTGLTHLRHFQVSSVENVEFEIWHPQVNPGTSLAPYQLYTNNSIAPLVSRGTLSGSKIEFGVNAYGLLVATVFDGTTTRTVTTPSTYNTGIFTKATANYTAAGKLSINVNGVEVAGTTGTPLLTMNNAAAVLTIGNSRTLDTPFPGSITMLKIGATVPTPEQEAWMYEQEKQMFRPGAQITLPEASPVLDLGYDESQDKWVAVQAGSESSFTGLIRTATSTPSAGSFTKVVAGSGVKALARDAGVDIQIPAYGLREELVKRSEAAAKASKTLSGFDFDSVVGQTDFVLPMGWKSAGVISAGNTHREGATKNFIRLFDGFRETIRFAVAPGAGVWIRINAIKE